MRKFQTFNQQSLYWEEIKNMIWAEFQTDSRNTLKLAEQSIGIKLNGSDVNPLS